MKRTTRITSCVLLLSLVLVGLGQAALHRRPPDPGDLVGRIALRSVVILA